MRRPDAVSVQLSLGLVLVVAIGGTARADEAGELFRRALALKDANQHSEACALFERSMRLAPADGTLLNVALCWKNHFGRFLEARAMFEKVEREAIAAGKTTVAEHARKELDALAQIMPHVTIELGNVPNGTVVELDGKPVATGTRLPLDPGTRKIRAYGARRVDYVAKAGQAGKVTLESSERTRPRQVLRLAAAGGGAMLLGSITGIVTLRKRDSAKAQCTTEMNELVCPQAALDRFDTARTLSHVTTGLFVVGIGLAGAAGFFEWKRRRELPPLVVEPSPDQVTVSLRGRW
jgi:hypothetical protein